LDDAKKAASERLRHHLDALTEQVDQVDPPTAHQQAEQGASIIDIRESHELAAGTAAGALIINRGMLELEIGDRISDPSRPLILMCAGGARSKISALSLHRLGYTRVASLSGGFDAWRAAGLPTEAVNVPDKDYNERYMRHLVIAEVGQAGQQRLAESHALIVGAGGLGSPVALYLAAAGVGRLSIVDADRVERSNLQRQILHSDHLVGHLKTESAAQRLAALNPTIQIDTFPTRLDKTNADQLVEPVDLVIDGSDNFPTRYLLNEVCIRHRKPLVYGAVLRFSGQVAVFQAGDGQSPCYRCLFPVPPSAEDSPNCAEAGVLGVMPGVIGSLQATEALKLLLGIGQSLRSRLLIYDALKAEFRNVRLVRDPACQTCRPGD